MRYARKCAQGVGDLLGGEADLEGGSGHQQKVLAVVAARHRQGISRKQAGGGVAHHALVINPEVGGLVVRTRAFTAHPGAAVPAAALLAQVWIIGIEEGARRAFKQPAFDGPVGLQAAVALEMVWGQRGPDADLGGHGGRRLNLVAAQFHHEPIRPRCGP